MAQMVAVFFNLDNKFITRANSSTFSQPAKRPPKTGFVIDKAINELGYTPHSFKKGIEIIADQIRQ
jgi:dTDP-4-dehydrorhamnose reductase